MLQRGSCTINAKANRAKYTILGEINERTKRNFKTIWHDPAQRKC